MAKKISKVSCACLEKEHTTLKASKIIKILKKFKDLNQCHLLDVGTGTGQVANEFSKVCKKVTSIDIVDERDVTKSFSFKLVKDETIPFPDNTFDIVISNQVIEHIEKQKKHIDEMYRVCKKGGIVFIGTPNKYWYKDVHYHLPLITIMPRWLADKYMRVFDKKDRYDIYPMSYFEIKSLCKNFSEFHNISIDVVKEPEKYNLDILKSLQPVIKRFPRFLLKAMNIFFPAFLIVVKK